MEAAGVDVTDILLSIAYDFQVAVMRQQVDLGSSAFDSDLNRNFWFSSKCI